MNNDKDLRELITRLNQLVEVLVKLKLEDVKGERSQKEMILFLGTLGCSSGDIARLLGVKETNVYPTLSRARQTKKRS
jgi:hypothetical protein